MKTKQQRDNILDISKAICICLMVIGHSGCPEYLNRFIYMFHMPCFFFISGWLLKDKYITDLKKGLFNKMKGSYYPFVKWSFIFLIFHNLLSSLYIYDNSYSLREYLIKIIRIFTMTGNEQLLGGYWFLSSLCWASLFTLLYLNILNRIWKIEPIGISIGIIGTLLIAFFEHRLPISIPYQLKEQTFLATTFYLSGYLFHKENMLHKFPFIMGLGLLIIPILTAFYVRWTMNNCIGWYVIPYYIVALSGTIGIFSISTWLSKLKMASLITYIGDKTLYILTFHFLAFKLISWIYIEMKCMPINCLAEFPVLQDTDSYLWVFYSITGIGISLLIWKIFHLKVLSLKTISINKISNKKTKQA